MNAIDADGKVYPSRMIFVSKNHMSIHPRFRTIPAKNKLSQKSRRRRAKWNQ